jgi:hypothetical protein
LLLCLSETEINPNLGNKRRVHHDFAVEPAAYDDAKAFLQGKGVPILDEEHAPAAPSRAASSTSTIPTAT